MVGIKLHRIVNLQLVQELDLGDHMQLSFVPIHVQYLYCNGYILHLFHFITLQDFM